MSWNPFNKLIAQRKSIPKAADDNELDQAVQTISQLEQNIKRLHKDTKKSAESSGGMTRVEQRMMVELLNSARQIKDGGDLVDYVEKLAEVTRKSSESQIDKDAIMRSTLIQPLTGLDDKFPVIHAAVKRREQSQQDYLKYLGRRDKFARDPNSSQSGKYEANEKYLDRTKADFERRSKQLQEDVPKFLFESLNYFDPCFKALMQSELNHNERVRNLYEDLAKDFQSQTAKKNDTFDQEVDKMLEEIKALSIVKAT